MSSDAEQMRCRLEELKEEIDGLRISRRVLMSLLSQEQKESAQERERLLREIDELRSKNRRLAQYAWRQRTEIPR